MFKSSVLLALAAVVLARKCTNITVPVSISARNGVFSIDFPKTDIEVTDFFLRFSYQGRNYTDTIVEDYATVSGHYELATTYCQPDSGPGSVLQVLTHGVGFDRSYWDWSQNNYNYSYVARAVDEFGYSTLTWDRLGVGKSSKGDPLSEIQISLEIAALHQLTEEFRAGKACDIKGSFDKVVHVGHSFGSSITYGLANKYPNTTDGIILSGFSQVPAYVGLFALGGNFVPVTDIPSLAKTYPAGYIAVSDSSALHSNFFSPGDFDPKVLDIAFKTGQAATPGELLTVGTGIGDPNSFSGPVLVITGERDIPFCGGDCLATSAISGSEPNLIAASKQFFKDASPFNATVVPAAGHGLNLGYSHTITYDTILEFIRLHV